MLHVTSRSSRYGRRKRAPVEQIMTSCGKATRSKDRGSTIFDENIIAVIEGRKIHLYIYTFFFDGATHTKSIERQTNYLNR